MHKKRRIIQVYAVIVNIIVVITFIISVTSLISALIDRQEPLYARYSSEDLSSFEKYKMDVLKSTQKEAVYIPTDEAVRSMYEAAKQERIKQVLHESNRTLIVSNVIIGICLILFVFHWWLLKRYDSATESLNEQGS